MKKLITMVLVTMMAFASVSAEASKRMGGGKSTGQQHAGKVSHMLWSMSQRIEIGI